MVRSQERQSFTIAKLAEAGGVSVEAVRFYQRRGLLRVPVRPNPIAEGGSIRRYDHDDIQTLRFIKSAQAAGFTLREISGLIELNAQDDRARARALARQRVAALDRQIADLQLARKALARLEQDCAENSEGPCPILAAFESR